MRQEDAFKKLFPDTRIKRHALYSSRVFKKSNRIRLQDMSTDQWHVCILFGDSVMFDISSASPNFRNISSSKLPGTVFCQVWSFRSDNIRKLSVATETWAEQITQMLTLQDGAQKAINSAQRATSYIRSLRSNVNARTIGHSRRKQSRDIFLFTTIGPSIWSGTFVYPGMSSSCH